MLQVLNRWQLIGSRVCDAAKMDNDWDLAIKYREIKPRKMDNDGYEGQNGSWLASMG
jgi:predicted nucleotidyltransferase